MEHLVEPLKENSKSAMISCVEMHNKPILPYRYEISIILAINAWELILKAFLIGNFSEINVILKDGTTKPFEECVACVSSNLGKSFRPIEENLKRLYEYRCNVIHFYEDVLDPILFSLLHKNVILYNEFMKDYYNIDLSTEANLFLMPIGFKPIASPVDFLSSTSNLDESTEMVRNFVQNLITSTEQLAKENVEDSILTGFKMAVINENRISNADIIAGITKSKFDAQLQVKNVLSRVRVVDDETAKRVKVDEESLFKTLYVFSYSQVATRTRDLYIDFKQNKKFNDIMKDLKGDPNYHKYRYLNMQEQKGMGQDWYTSAVFDELGKHYSKKEE